jgi:RNA polymerase sigma-70 factor (ECF subfamily)
MNDDDAALLAAVRDGSELAFNTIVDRHQQAVRTFLRRIMGNESDADDLAQETFLIAWRQARSFRGESSVRSWLCGIAWRKAKEAQRTWARRRERDTEHHARLAADTGSARMEDRLAVKRALATLPLEQRAAVILCLVCGFSHTEAATILGAALGTVKSHVLRGRERLITAIEASV